MDRIKDKVVLGLLFVIGIFGFLQGLIAFVNPALSYTVLGLAVPVGMEDTTIFALYRFMGGMVIAWAVLAIATALSAHKQVFKVYSLFNIMMLIVVMLSSFLGIWLDPVYANVIIVETSVLLVVNMVMLLRVFWLNP